MDGVRREWRGEVKDEGIVMWMSSWNHQSDIFAKRA
jgi:hypothetical protein